MSLANHQIKKDTQTITETVIINLLKMLMYRKWLNLDDKNDIKKLVDELLKSRKEDKIYNIKLTENLINVATYEPFDNKTEWKAFNGNNVVVLLSNLKIAGKSPVLNEFMNKYANFHKIIVVDSITEKARQILTSGKFIEIFEENEFMINITEHVCCPEFIVLKNEELENFLESYNAKRKDLLKQLDSDPMSRYLYLRRGQVIRVVRNSETTGQSVAYRIIIHRGNSGAK
jgi:DNA-directed RNA polymerase subunit H (RpoH/RPB5)